MRALQFVDAASISNDGKIPKNVICKILNGKKLVRSMESFSDHLENAKARNLDVSACNLDIVDYNLGPSISVTDAMLLISDTLDRSNACVQKLLDSN